MLMIDFDGGMDFIESERDIYTKKQLLIVHVYSNLHIDWKKLLKIITGVLYLSNSFWLQTFWSVRISNSW